MKWMLRWIDMSGPPGLLRRSLAIICVGIGILGAVAPIIPGWPAFLFAIVLLGRRDRSVRLTHLVLRRTLRWLRRRPHPSMRQIGRQVSDQYVRLRRFLTPRPDLDGKRYEAELMDFPFPDPGMLRDNDLELIVRETYPGNAEKGFVPEYRFAMRHATSRTDMGTLDLRVRLTEKLKQYGGHIGYEVAEAYRGNHYAARSCRLLFPLIQKLGLQPLIITCNPTNLASVKTIESLGGKLISTSDIEIEPGMWRLTSVYFVEVDMSQQKTVATLEHALNAYVEGLRAGKLELLQTLFWGDGQFCLHVESEEKILCRTFREVLGSWVTTPDPEARGKIIAQEQIEGVMARVTYELIFHNKLYIDYLLLYLVDSKWTVVAKTTVVQKQLS